ncbi:adenosylhomocysteinase [Rubrobacter tropicus]|uniref:Adenosylhomocysteinase n=1 Tax=Rubrobacter tropicus TaxID=2653851 RepID=A0A6G8QEV9_9ACTN|nr:NAD(P)-dependent oxidoreductase [Rubrobacter tropicus]QIN84777.1 adenosylhomocysteinase [Rubrobacter tropicus]
MVPYFEALLTAGAEVHACAANPATTRNDVAEHLETLGVRVPARKDDPPQRHAAHLRTAIEAGPTLLSEMGADATAATGGRLATARGGLEATGTGIARLKELDLSYPVFDWDSVPMKQGLHNRHLVGLMAANTFLDVTGLSLYGKTVLVVGYGPVGRGIADAARSFGAVVEVCDPDPAARLAAAHLGFPTPTLEAGLPRADVVFTATGRDGVIPIEALSCCKNDAFLANLGHTSGELPVEDLRRHAVGRPRRHVERITLDGKALYLLAGGAMFNLAAGPGDPYDTFDLVTALVIEATGFLATEGVEYPPGIHPLPKKVQDRAARGRLESGA